MRIQGLCTIRRVVPAFTAVLGVAVLLAARVGQAQPSSATFGAWQKAWEFALPGDTIAAALADFGREDGIRLVTLHPDKAKEDVLQVRIWKRAAQGWQTEWQSELTTGELRAMVVGNFIRGQKGAQILTPRHLIIAGDRGYEMRSRKDEVSWFGYACSPEGSDTPIAAFPGGMWKGVLNLESREGWLRFERVQVKSFLSLPSQFGDAAWVVLVSTPTLGDVGDEVWTRQGYDRLFAQVGKVVHPDEPFLVSRRLGEERQSLQLVVPPTLSAPSKVLWQSEPIAGTVREAQIVSAPGLRGGLLVLVHTSGACRVQFWQIQRQGNDR